MQSIAIIRNGAKQTNCNNYCIDDALYLECHFGHYVQYLSKLVDCFRNYTQGTANAEEKYIV